VSFYLNIKNLSQNKTLNVLAEKGKRFYRCCASSRSTQPMLFFFKLFIINYFSLTQCYDALTDNAAIFIQVIHQEKI